MSVKHAVIILSGGQDSTTAALVARRNYELTAAVFFDYGQRHLHAEEKAYDDVVVALGIRNVHKVRVGSLSLVSPSALLRPGDDLCAPHHVDDRLPATFVPGRNLLFMTLSAAVAYQYDAPNLFLGVCQTDYSGYPDCRRETVDAMQRALILGLAWPQLVIHTPIMDLNKAQTFELAEQLGEIDLIRHTTHTCYEGDRTTFHAWGYGCNQCPACVLRRDGWFSSSCAE